MREAGQTGGARPPLVHIYIYITQITQITLITLIDLFISFLDNPDNPDNPMYSLLIGQLLLQTNKKTPNSQIPIPLPRLSTHPARLITHLTNPVHPLPLSPIPRTQAKCPCPGASAGEVLAGILADLAATIMIIPVNSPLEDLAGTIMIIPANSPLVDLAGI